MGSFIPLREVVVVTIRHFAIVWMNNKRSEVLSSLSRKFPVGISPMITTANLKKILMEQKHANGMVVVTFYFRERRSKSSKKENASYLTPIHPPYHPLKHPLSHPNPPMNQLQL